MLHPGLSIHRAEEALPLPLASCFRHHSGDETVCFKRIRGVSISLSLFFPPAYSGGEGRFPLLVLIHGGGWKSRKIFPDQPAWAGDYLGYLARYYAGQGFVAASLDYRLLSGEASRLLDLCGDCMDALRFLREKAERYRLDLGRAFLLGESAGGYLAAATLTLPPRRLPFPFRGAVLANPITDLSDPQWRQSAFPDRPEALSPLHHPLTGLCPLLLLHGTADRTVSPVHSEKFFQKAAQSGTAAALHLFEGERHAFLLPEYTQNPAAASAAIRVIDGFLPEDLPFKPT